MPMEFNIPRPEAGPSRLAPEAPRPIHPVPGAAGPGAPGGVAIAAGKSFRGVGISLAEQKSTHINVHF